MTKPIHLAAVLVAMFAYGTPAAAQTIYRCGESYSNKPCPGATVVPADDPPSAARRAESQAQTQRDARAAEAMEKARLEQEAKPAQLIAPARAAEPLESAPRVRATGHVGRPGVFKAVAPHKPGQEPVNMKKKAAKKKPV